MSEPREVPCADTRTEMTWIVMPGQANSLGTVFGGQVMAWIDVCAAVAAQRFARKSVVTAEMDSLTCRGPIQQGQLAGIRRDFTQDQRKEARFPTTIRARHPDLLAVMNLQARILDQQPGTTPEGEL